MQKIGLGSIAFAVLLFLVVTHVNGIKRRIPIIFSQKEVLQNVWEQYKLEYLEATSGRTLDKQQNNITTSEGQSYTMLRAVWMDDREIFDASFKWTQDNLKHKNDALHAWLFGETSPGIFGIMTSRGGQNSATDAETDIALSLLFAYAKWNDASYLSEAKALIKDIWSKEVVTIEGKKILAANDVERLSSTKVIVNPSYFSPYAYKIFAGVDTAHDWDAVANSSYDIIRESSTSTLDKTTSAGIVPDWIEIDRKSGALRAVSSETLTTNYSYDALRLPWRIALDYVWYKDPRAKEVLDGFAFFSDEWNTKSRINVTYLHDGTTTSDMEVPAAYGGIIGYFMVSDSTNASEVYKRKLQILYNPDTNSWRTTLSYYDDNWAWFGIGLYENLLPNLSTLLPSTLKRSQ